MSVKPSQRSRTAVSVALVLEGAARPSDADRSERPATAALAVAPSPFRKSRRLIAPDVLGSVRTVAARSANTMKILPFGSQQCSVERAWPFTHRLSKRQEQSGRVLPWTFAPGAW